MFYFSYTDSITFITKSNKSLLGFSYFISVSITTLFSKSQKLTSFKQFEIFHENDRC